MIEYSNLDKLISSEVSALGFELIGFEFNNSSNPKILRIYADVKSKKVSIDDTHIIPGITLDDCGKINYHLSKVLSVTSNLEISNYILEVSSPGVERRLFNLLQMEQNLGKEVKLRLKVSINNCGNFIGTLKSVDHALNSVFIEVDGQNLCFDFDNVARANLVYRKF